MISMTAMGQRAYRVTKDTTDGGLIFNGLVTFENLAREPTFTWYQKGVDEYVPAEKPVSLLKFYMRQYQMIVFMGTWCDDSHNLIPKLEKVLKQVGYPDNLVMMYGVDRAKTTIGGEHKKFEITNVPTIILMKGENEAGRITETVKTSVEADLSAIIQSEMAGQEPH